MTAPLSRNRNYQLLWSSKALAEFGAQGSYRLPAAGVVADGIGIGYRTGAGYKRRSGTCCRFASGALLDRWNCKKVMLGCEAAQVIAATTLVVALVVGVASVAHIVIVAAVMGVCSALFEPAEKACLPSLMSTEQVGRRVGMNAVRGHLGNSPAQAGGVSRVLSEDSCHSRWTCWPMPCPSCSCSSACRRPRNDESRSVDSAKRLRPAFAGCAGTARFDRFVRRGAQPVLRRLLHRQHRGGTSTRRTVWRDRHYGGDVRCRWDPWRPGRPLPAAEGHSFSFFSELKPPSSTSVDK